MDKASALLSINEAFIDIPRPETSLRQFLLTDQKGMSETITEEEWSLAGNTRVDSSWQEIPDSEIEYCGVLTAHMDAAAFKYYLPAYMRYSIEHTDSPILAFTLFSLAPPSQPGYRKEEFSLLDWSQEESIANFLRYVCEHAEESDRYDAVQALKHWST